MAQTLLSQSVSQSVSLTPLLKTKLFNQKGRPDYLACPFLFYKG